MNIEYLNCIYLKRNLQHIKRGSDEAGKRTKKGVRSTKRTPPVPQLWIAGGSMLRPG
jgi:hypothetical protein